MKFLVKDTEQIRAWDDRGPYLTSEVKTILVILHDGTILIPNKIDYKHHNKKHMVDMTLTFEVSK